MVKVTYLVLVVLLLPGPIQASPGLDAMNFFFTEIHSFVSRFGQVILDESFNEIDSNQGKVWVQRPGNFRWSYDAPDRQEIVGDGENVWIYDIELEQVVVKSQDLAIGNSPAVLLAGRGKIEDNYEIIDIGTQGRFDWVNLIARDEENGFREVRLGFEDNRLRLMELLDNLDQRTRISFVDLRENITIPITIFEFIPPEGVDVIDDS